MATTAKRTKTPPPPVILTIQLPAMAGLMKTGTIIAKAGDVAVMDEFDYSNVAGIAAAITAASQQLAIARTAPKPTAADHGLSTPAREELSEQPATPEALETPDDDDPDTEADATDTDDATSDDSLDLLASDDTPLDTDHADLIPGVDLVSTSGQTALL